MGTGAGKRTGERALGEGRRQERPLTRGHQDPPPDQSCSCGPRLVLDLSLLAEMQVTKGDMGVPGVPSLLEHLVFSNLGDIPTR